MEIDIIHFEPSKNTTLRLPPSAVVRVTGNVFESVISKVSKDVFGIYFSMV